MIISTRLSQFLTLYCQTLLKSTSEIESVALENTECQETYILCNRVEIHKTSRGKLERFL